MRIGRWLEDEDEGAILFPWEIKNSDFTDLREITHIEELELHDSKWAARKFGARLG